MRNIRLDKQNSIGILTIDRPKALNALNRETLEEIRLLLQESKDLKAMILTGEGKAFIAGADIQEMYGIKESEMLEFCKLGQEVAHLFETAPFVTIACVNGYALGGGLEMALGCDFVYASKNAVLGLPEVTLGLIPGFGGTQRLLRAVGIRKAKEMILSGEKVTADQAYELGIVNRVFKPDELIPEAIKRAEMISNYSQIAVKNAKQAINEGADITLEKGLTLERELCSESLDTEACKQAMVKFLGKHAG